MPGRRNLAREAAQHAHEAPAKFASLYAMMTATLPAHDRVLIGRTAILEHLHALHLRRPNGRPLTWRIVLRWRVSTGFPVLPGRRLLNYAYSSSPISTTHAVTAWLLTRLASTEYAMFTIAPLSLSHDPSPTREGAPQSGTADSASDGHRTAA